jgi:hypothetical protein
MVAKAAVSGALSLLLVGAYAHAEEIGWVDSISGPVGGIEILRQGKVEPLRVFLTLHDGDQIVVTNAAAAIVVGLGEGKSMRVDSTKTPFTLKKTGATPSIPGNLLKWMGGLLDTKASKSNASSLASMSTRGKDDGGQLVVPYLAKRFFVAATTRPMYFSWAGGTPPFEIQLKRQSDGVVLYKQEAIKDRKVTTPVLELAPGDYSLEISDSAKTSYEDFLQAVPGGAIPKRPDTPETRNLSPQTSALMGSLWLASVENGRWIVETIQQLALQAKTNPSAGEFLGRIEGGLEVSKPE